MRPFQHRATGLVSLDNKLPGGSLAAIRAVLLFGYVESDHRCSSRLTPTSVVHSAVFSRKRGKPVSSPSRTQRRQHRKSRTLARQRNKSEAHLNTEERYLAMIASALTKAEWCSFVATGTLVFEGRSGKGTRRSSRLWIARSRDSHGLGRRLGSLSDLRWAHEVRPAVRLLQSRH
jgi:hypothetical protein